MSTVIDMISRGWENFLARPQGMLNLRFILQPTIAAMLALRAGIKDAKQKRPPYLWAAFTKPAYRSQLLHGGWKDIRTPFLVSAVLDAIYQLVTHRFIYPAGIALHGNAAGARAVFNSARPGESDRRPVHTHRPGG